MAYNYISLCYIIKFPGGEPIAIGSGQAESYVALSGLRVIYRPTYPGRCPGLVYCALSGLYGCKQVSTKDQYWIYMIYIQIILLSCLKYFVVLEATFNFIRPYRR